MTENQLTAAVHRYVNQNYPALRRMYFHIPNEAPTSDRHRMQLFAMGVLAGVPDFLFLLHAVNGVLRPQIWFLELKTVNGVQSEKQAAISDLWASRGIKCQIAYGFEDAKKIIDENLKTYY